MPYIGSPVTGSFSISTADIANSAITVAKLGTGALIGTNIQAFDTDTAKTDVAQ